MSSTSMKYLKFRKYKNKHYIFDSKVLIDEVNDLLGTNIEEDMDTIGGWMPTHNFDLEKGESVVFGGYEFKVLEIEDHHIKRIEVFPAKIDLEAFQKTEVLL